MKTDETGGRTLRLKLHITSLAFALIILALLAAAGSGVLAPHRAAAQPILNAEGACDPHSVRPDEPVLITCTTLLTNEGDDVATDLVANIGPADGCNSPIPTFIDRTENGVLLPTAPLQLSFELPDIAPGDTLESVTRLAVVNHGEGPTGGAITVVSRDDPGVTAGGEFCWDVASEAEAPPTNLIVAMTPVTDFDVPPIEPIPETPRAPAGDGVPAPPPLPVRPPAPDQAEFEIVISNVSDVEVTDVVLLDVPLGNTVLIGAEPPVTGTDSLGRPVWELGRLDPGDELRIRATYGPAPDDNCSYADEILIVNATPAGEEQEDYVAFSGDSVPVGPCDFEPDLCWHYPPEGDPMMAPCEEEVCWATSPADGELQPIFGGCDQEYCWYLPPGEGYPALRTCAEEVCWVSFGDAGFERDLVDVPCDVDFCEFTAPDGTESTRERCDSPVCWSSAPGGGAWELVWDCGGGQDQCWFSPPGEGPPVLRPCAEETCWVSFGDGGPLSDVPCDLEFCEFSAPDGSTSTEDTCDSPVCWSKAPTVDSWEAVYGCGEYEDMCWYSLPGDESRSSLGWCGDELRFAVNPPKGAVDFGILPNPIYFEGPACWPIPPDEVEQFYTMPLPCEEVESTTWFIPPNGGPAFPNFGMPDACWYPLPPEADVPPGAELPPDLLIPSPCLEGDQPTDGESGSSVPADVVDPVSTPAETVEGTVKPIEPLPSAEVSPAEIVDGTVERIEPLPSVEVIPADLIHTDRVEPAPPDVTLPIEQPVEPAPRDENETRRPPGTEDVPGDDQADADLQVSSLPDTGAGPASRGTGNSPFAAIAGALAVTGGLLASAAAGLRRRRTL